MLLLCDIIIYGLHEWTPKVNGHRINFCGLQWNTVIWLYEYPKENLLLVQLIYLMVELGLWYISMTFKGRAI